MLSRWAFQVHGKSVSIWLAVTLPEMMRSSTSASQASGSTLLSFAVLTSDARTAKVLPPRSLPTNNEFYRLLKAHDLITSPAYVVIKAADAFHTKTTRPNEMWQTDFTYFKIIGWGWMYLSTVLDDFSRYIIAWKLCTNMRAEDVTDTLDLALAASGCDSATVLHKPRLLSDNGPSYIAGELAEYIEARKMSHVRGAPCHPQTQGKIERWHQTLKNRILLENYFLPGDLEAQIEAYIDHYNHRRYHESLGNVTPADAYFGRAPAIIKQRERIKRQTIQYRRLQHRKLAA